MAIPSSRLPGHQRLHERVVAALERCQESQDVEFKEAATWEALKWKIIRTVLGMGNLRDGGFIVVGVSERDGEWRLTGITPYEKPTYDADDIIAEVHAYVSPYVGIDVVTVEYGAAEFIVLNVREFDETPLVCMKNGPNDSGIIKGRIYIRPPGKPETTMIRSATDLHELLDLAAEKRARRMLEASRRIGLVEPGAGPDRQTADEQFRREAEGL